MPDKGSRTKTQILQAARALFIEKGYTAVSMSDLCAATGLSRGGLYRHFSSTGEVFSALLTLDKEHWEEGMVKAVQSGTSAVQMLSFFFEQCKQEIADNAGQLSLATYEFERSGQDEHDFLMKRYENAVDMMEQLLRYGQKRGELCVTDPRAEAEHLTIYLEGLKVATTAIPFSKEMIAKQLAFQLQKITAGAKP